jgi:hypothetical protein
MIFGARRRARDHAHRAARMRLGMIRPAHFRQRHDLRASANIIRLVRHCGELLSYRVCLSETGFGEELRA